MRTEVGGAISTVGTAAERHHVPDNCRLVRDMETTAHTNSAVFHNACQKRGA
jgi:hypothetical protein